MRRLTSIVLLLAMAVAGVTPAAADVSAAGAAAHACCTRLGEAPADSGCHSMVRLTCCPPPARDAGVPQAPPVSSATPHAQELAKSPAGEAGMADVTLPTRVSAAAAFTAAQLHLLHDPVYLRNTSLLV